MLVDLLGGTTGVAGLAALAFVVLFVWWMVRDRPTFHSDPCTHGDHTRCDACNCFCHDA